MKNGSWSGVALLVFVAVSSNQSWAQEAAAPLPIVAPPAAEPPAAPVAVPAAQTAPAVEVAPATLPQAAAPTSLKLHVKANQPGVAFYYAKQPNASSRFVPEEWTRLCLEECDAYVPRGPYRLALAQGAKEPVMAPDVFDSTTATRLEGGYTDNSSRRLAGWLVLGLGGVASVSNIAFGAGIAGNVSGGEGLATATIIGGTVGLLLSLAVGIPLAASSDDSLVEAAGAKRY